MHFGSRKKQVLGVQHRSGAGGLVKRGSRALWGARGAESGRLTWKTDSPIAWEKLFGVYLLGLVFSKVAALSLPGVKKQMFAGANGAWYGGDTPISRALL